MPAIKEAPRQGATEGKLATGLREIKKPAPGDESILKPKAVETTSLNNSIPKAEGLKTGGENVLATGQELRPSRPKAEVTAAKPAAQSARVK